MIWARQFAFRLLYLAEPRQNVRTRESFSKSLIRDMSVDLCRRDARVAEHSLNEANVNTCFNPADVLPAHTCVNWSSVRT